MKCLLGSDEVGGKKSYFTFPHSLFPPVLKKLLVEVLLGRFHVLSAQISPSYLSFFHSLIATTFLYREPD